MSYINSELALRVCTIINYYILGLKTVCLDCTIIPYKD